MTTIKWNLRKVMADKGIWSGQELVDLLEKKAGVILTHSAVMALINKQPRAVRFTTLEALCVALDVEPAEIMIYTPSRAAKGRAVVGGEGGPVAPYKRKSVGKKETLYPEEDF